MAARYDVAARLNEGLPAVDDLQIYVDASRLRGYQHPDLTARIRDSYTAEEGLDLRVLDADCAALRGVTEDVADALRLARSQVVVLADAWAGPGGIAASEFIVRHCDTAAVVDDSLRAAADACVVLRDELWRVVDRRVSVTQEIAERAQAARPGWLAAAHAVLAGQAEQGDAGEIVDNQVTPFVDSAVRLDWVVAMRLADGDAAAAYGSAVDAAGSTPWVSFDLPGDLGPRYPEARPPTAPAPPSAPVAPVASPSALVGGQPVVPAAAPPVAPPNPLDALASASPLSPPNGMTGLGTPAIPDLGGGIGAPGRFADTLGGLLGGGPTGTQMPDPLEVPELDVPEVPDADADEEDTPGDDDPEAADDEPDDEPDGTAEPVTEPPAEGAAEPIESETGPTEAISIPECDPPTPTPPAPPPLPAEPSTTPCEIAADELPQAGQ